MSIHVACLWMCVLFYLSFVSLHVCAYASKFKVHCGSAFEPGASGLPHYCTPSVCVPAVINWFWLRGWQNNKRAICAGTAHVFWNFISLFERPRTRLVGKIGSQNQSVGELAVWRHNQTKQKIGYTESWNVSFYFVFLHVREGPKGFSVIYPSP